MQITSSIFLSIFQPKKSWSSDHLWQLCCSIWSRCVLSSGCRANLRRPCSSVKGTMRAAYGPTGSHLPSCPLIQLDWWQLPNFMQPPCWLVRGALKLHICPLRQFVSPQNGLSVRRSFSRWPYSVPQACYFNPSTDMAPLARCLDHTEPSIVALTDAYQPNQTTGLCVYGIVDSFKDILVIIYSINYRI